MCPKKSKKDYILLFVTRVGGGQGGLTSVQSMKRALDGIALFKSSEKVIVCRNRFGKPGNIISNVDVKIES